MAAFPSRVASIHKMNDIKANDVIRPTSRSFGMGEYPVQTYKTLSGKVVRRSFGNKASNFPLELSFENVDEGVVNTIYDHYHGQGGSAEGFSLPSELFSGYKQSATQANFKNISDTLWFYSEPPNVQSTALGLSNVTVRFVGDLL